MKLLFIIILLYISVLNVFLIFCKLIYNYYFENNVENTLKKPRYKNLK